MRSFISAFIILVVFGGGLYLVSVLTDDKEIEGVNINKEKNQLIFPGEENQNNNQQKSDNELKAEIIREGSGQQAKTGDVAVVHYEGYLENGTKFDSSRDKEQPFKFSLGAGQVIQGWDLGVVGMKIGEVRKLYIPSSLAYGEQGAGNIIPPNANLIFEIELLDLE